MRNKDKMQGLRHVCTKKATPFDYTPYLDNFWYAGTGIAGIIWINQLGLSPEAAYAKFRADNDGPASHGDLSNLLPRAGVAWFYDWKLVPNPITLNFDMSWKPSTPDFNKMSVCWRISKEFLGWCYVSTHVPGIVPPLSISVPMPGYYFMTVYSWLSYPLSFPYSFEQHFGCLMPPGQL